MHCDLALHPTCQGLENDLHLINEIEGLDFEVLVMIDFLFGTDAH